MYQGSCCCGRVRFEISRLPKVAGACHCSRCRKLGATPFAMVFNESLEILAGLDAIVRCMPEPPFRYVRSFCGSCGTSLGELLSPGSLIPIPLNCFDQDLGLPITFHEHVAAKPDWEMIPIGPKLFDGDPM